MQRAPEDSELRKLASFHFLFSSPELQRLRIQQALLEKEGKVEFEPRFT